MTEFCEICGKKLDKKKKQTRFCSRKCFGKSKIIDLTGQKFGRLMVIRLDHIDNKRTNGGGEYYWLCKCDCGNETCVSSSALKQRKTQSCGCLQKEIVSIKRFKHGQNKTKLHNIYFSMKGRCYNIKNTHYKDYGGRGIVVCNEWQDFMNFYNWAINNGYKEGLSLDRINNNKGYSPDNCRWTTQKEQCRNTRRNRYITYNGETQIITDWAKEYNIDWRILTYRLNKGWDIEKALTMPIRQIRKKAI